MQAFRGAVAGMLSLEMAISRGGGGSRGSPLAKNDIGGQANGKFYSPQMQMIVLQIGGLFHLAISTWKVYFY